jgi:hypothetical protein
VPESCQAAAKKWHELIFKVQTTVKLAWRFDTMAINDVPPHDVTAWSKRVSHVN